VRNDKDPQRDERRQALWRTTLIVVLVLAAAFAFSLAMTRRLISTWNP
jgi:hypothetical protein